MYETLAEHGDRENSVPPEESEELFINILLDEAGISEELKYNLTKNEQTERLKVTKRNNTSRA
jgi:hypothetical protein